MAVDYRLSRPGMSPDVNLHRAHKRADAALYAARRIRDDLSLDPVGHACFFILQKSHNAYLLQNFIACGRILCQNQDKVIILMHLEGFLELIQRTNKSVPKFMIKSHALLSRIA
jgi:hypothetical protein